MNLSIITSFNEQYYNLIGKESVRSWLNFWPTELTLTCYVEEFKLPVHDRIKQISFDQLPQAYFDFQDSNENDRVKLFAKKAYSVIHAMETSSADRIIWIDADVISKKHIDLEFIESLCPSNTLASFMGVNHHIKRGDLASPVVFSAETGFFILNTTHKNFKQFAARYQEYYNQHLSQGLRRFYDGDVFGAVIDEFRNNSKINDMCDSMSKSPKSPLKYTELGQYIHHFKSKHSKDNFNQRQYASVLDTFKSVK
jgi:hypothetical protein